MIFGADRQNQNLRSASRIKPSPTQKTVTANHYSAAISTSKSKLGQRTIQHQSRQNIGNQSDPVRGSFEGLQNGKSSYVQMNNTGYDNAKFQNARYKVKTNNIPTVKGASFIFTNGAKKSIINNYSGTTARGTSSDRMKNNLNINRMI